MESSGFFVLYFNYAEICSLFETIGISIHWEENTSEADLQRIADSLRFLDDVRRNQLFINFFAMYQKRLNELALRLCEALDTFVSDVVVVPIHGTPKTLHSIDDAINFVLQYDESSVVPILRYEIIVRYSNGDEYTMKCSNKSKAVQFLNQYT